MTNAMEGDLLNVSQDVLEMSVDEGTPSIDGVRGHVRRQLERLQLHRQGWQSQEQRNYQDKGSGNQNGSIHGTLLTCHRGIIFGQPHLNGTGLLLARMKGSLRDPEVDLKLSILPSHLSITILSHPPLMKETPGVIAIVGVERIRR